MESVLKNDGDEQLKQETNIDKEFAINATSRRFWMTISLVLSDFLALLLSALTAIGIRTILPGLVIGASSSRIFPVSPTFDPDVYFQQIPLLGLFLVGYASVRLYPSVGMSRVEEVRLLSIATSLIAASYATILFLAQQGQIYSRFVFGVFWVVSLFLVPISRVLLRNVMSRAGWWGVPAGVVGDGPTTRRTTAFLLSHPNLGIHPCVYIGDKHDQQASAGPCSSIPFKSLHSKEFETTIKQLDTLIVIQKEIPLEVLRALVSESKTFSPRIIMMPDLPSLGSVWVQSVDLGGVLALKIRNNLGNPFQQLQKRVMDLILAGIGSLFISPWLALIAIAIKLDSPGPILYRQERIGKGGKIFSMLKFRTMHMDAGERLARILSENPQRRSEWETYQKLADDPRVTKVGAFLRSFSLDEFPQLWNVLRGEMSLVGPRPFLPAQKEMYGISYSHYIQVRPGITGSWQINGRNKSSFSQRAEMDEYYVRNWSVWLDLYLLARTPLAVFTRDGAY